MPANAPYRDPVTGRFAVRKQEIVKQHVDKLLKIRNNFREKVGNSSGTCHYATVLDNWELQEQIQDICHARLRPRKDARYIILDAMQHFNDMKEKEKPIYKKWMKYLVNDSPFAEAFLTKNIKEGIELGFILDTSKGKDQIYCAAIAMRTAHEFRYILNAWKEMEGYHIPPLARFMLAHSMQFDKEGNVSPGCRSGHHIVFSSRLSLDDFKKTLKRNAMHDKGKAFNSDDAYRMACHTPFTGSYARYDDGGGISLITKLESFSKLVKQGFGTVMVIPAADVKPSIETFIKELLK